MKLMAVLHTTTLTWERDSNMGSGLTIRQHETQVYFLLNQLEFMGFTLDSSWIYFGFILDSPWTHPDFSSFFCAFFVSPPESPVAVPGWGLPSRPAIGCCRRAARRRSRRRPGKGRWPRGPRLGANLNGSFWHWHMDTNMEKSIMIFL